MTKIVTVAEMRAIEQAADKAGHSYRAMMEQAGRAVADHIITVLINENIAPSILVLVGPGNNGGDGLVAARYLMDDLADTEIAAYLLKPRDDDDDVFRATKEAGVTIIEVKEDKDFEQLKAWVADASIIVDGMFGTGARLPIKGAAAKLLKQVHQTLAERDHIKFSLIDPIQPLHLTDRPVIVAVDCPSGLDCDTGELDSLALTADSTVTFAAAKPGLLSFPGANAVGRLRIGDIGLPEKLKEHDSIKLHLAEAITVGSLLPERPRDGHKGSFGKAMIVAGSTNYIGAPYLAGDAAYKVGTGLVTIGAPQVIVPTLAGMLPEATWLLLPHEMGVVHERAVEVLREAIEGYTALLMGPGFGQEEVTGKFLHELLQAEVTKLKPKTHIGFSVPVEEDTSEDEVRDPQLPPLVIDADGLNLLAKIDHWWKLLPRNTILTPHPAEFARLARIESAKDVQADRLHLALKYAKKWKCVVVLKGAYTIVAQPNGKATIMPFATSALATAGTGDVLAGAIVGLLAQGLTPADAAVAGAWIQGAAGSVAELAQTTPTSVTAREILVHFPFVISEAERTR